MRYWKQVAVERLRHYQQDRLAVENLSQELLRGKVPGSGNARMDCMVARKELRARLIRLRRSVAQVGRAMEILTPEERMIFQLCYFQPRRGNVDKLCTLLGREKSTIYRRRDKALRRFTEALYGRGEKASLV